MGCVCCFSSLRLVLVPSLVLVQKKRDKPFPLSLFLPHPLENGNWKGTGYSNRLDLFNTCLTPLVYSAGTIDKTESPPEVSRAS